MGAPCKLVIGETLLNASWFCEGNLINEKSRNMKNTQRVLRVGVGGIRLT